MELELLRRTADTIEVADTEPQRLQARPLAGIPGLHLTQVERRAVEELVTGVPGETADFVSQRAAAFAGETSAETRRRSLSKAAAIQECLMSQLTTLLAAAVARRDVEAAKLLDRCLNGATTRFQLVLNQLQSDIAGGKKPTVQVGVVANTVHVSGGG